MRYMIILLATLSVGCTSLSVKPQTMDKKDNNIVYSQRGGEGMRHRAKSILEQRGWDVRVGKVKNDTQGDRIEILTQDVGNVHYYVWVREDVRWAPITCLFAGAEMWSFTVSIADNKTGDEILNWDSWGCANTSAARFEKLLDKLESN